METMDKYAVLAAVRRYADAEEPADVPIEVLTDRVYFEAGWWHVPVRTRPEMPKRFRYYEKLADIEENIKNGEKMDVILVPAE